MNKNNINFQVHRTKESTLIELISGLLVLLSLILSIVLFIKVREAGAGMLLQTGSIGFGVLLMLFLAYKPTVIMAGFGLLFVPLLCWYFHEYIKIKKNRIHE